MASARCTFPDYDIIRAVDGGAPIGGGGASAGRAGGVSVAGGAGSGGGSAVPSDGGVPDARGGTDSSPDGGGLAGEASGGEPGGGGSGGGCIGDQWPVERCEAVGCAPRYPEHCYDGDRSGDEVAVDCGGSCQACTNQACQQDRDCLSSRCEPGDNGATCYAPLSIGFVSHDKNAHVDNTSWKIRLRNEEPADGQTFSLPDLKVRYYFKRSGVVEPLLVRSMQSDLFQQNGSSRALTATSWSIERVELVRGAAYDAYLELGFGDAGRLGSGERIEVYQQLVTGWVGHTTFDQNANYSFPGANDDALHLAVFYRGHLVWGLEPGQVDPRACFARAVNLNGAAVSVDGVQWQAATDADVATNGSSVTLGNAPFPPADAGLTTMLGTATRLDAGEELNLRVDDASYLVYLYAASPSNAQGPATLTVQGAATDAFAGFRAQMVDNNHSAWARLGPFRADVTTGQLNVKATQGTIALSGIELWYPD